MRVISLIASSTEIVCALGYEKNLVGRSHECDYPESVLSLPVCSGPRFDTNGTSLEIDQRVKAAVQEALSVYRLDVEKLKELKPDVIITQDHCEVCAVSLKDVETAVCDWFESKPVIVALKPDCLEDIWQGIYRIAEALGEPQRGRALVKEYKDRMQKISARVKTLRPKPSVACIEWIDPLMAAGNWVPELVEMLGAKNLFGQSGKHAPWMNWEDLCQEDPDVMVVMSCGWDIERNRKEMATLAQKPEWAALKAVQRHRVYITDGNQYFNRPGPRLVESLEILAEVLYPEAFEAKHRGTGLGVRAKFEAAPGTVLQVRTVPKVEFASNFARIPGWQTY